MEPDFPHVFHLYWVDDSFRAYFLEWKKIEESDKGRKKIAYGGILHAKVIQEHRVGEDSRGEGFSINLRISLV